MSARSAWIGGTQRRNVLHRRILEKDMMHATGQDDPTRVRGPERQILEHEVVRADADILGGPAPRHNAGPTRIAFQHNPGSIRPGPTERERTIGARIEMDRLACSHTT